MLTQKSLIPVAQKTTIPTSQKPLTLTIKKSLTLFISIGLITTTTNQSLYGAATPEKSIEQHPTLKKYPKGIPSLQYLAATKIIQSIATFKPPFTMAITQKRIPHELYEYLNLLYQHSETHNNIANNNRNAHKNGTIKLHKALLATASSTTLSSSLKKKLIEDLIKSGAHVDTQDSSRRTPLLLIAQFDDPLTIKTLLDYTAKNDHCDKALSTALITAAIHGNVEALLTIIDHGVNPNQSNDHGCTPLIAAASSGHMPVVIALCDLPTVEIHKTNHNGDNALMWAAHKGQVNVVRFLRGLTNTNINHQNSHGWSALYSATIHPDGITPQHIEVIRELLTPPTMLKHQGSLLSADCIDPNCPDDDGITPLMQAALHDCPEAVASLLATPNINPRLFDSTGRTALSIAQKRNFTPIVRMLAPYL